MNLLVNLVFCAIGLGLLAAAAQLLSRRLTGMRLLWWAGDLSQASKPKLAEAARWLLIAAIGLLGLFWLGYSFQLRSIEFLAETLMTFGLISAGAWVGAAWMLGPQTWSGLRGTAEFIDDTSAATLRRENAAQGRGAEIQLGLLGNGKRFSWQTDKHVLLLASSRSGKGTDLLIPNLLTYDGPVFVLDPKGENARATARHRATLGPVYCLDPWGLTGRPSSRFNPLRRLTLPGHEDDVGTGAAAMAVALVLPDHGNNRYFTDSARQLIEALIAYAVSEPNLRPVADLKLVRTLLTQHARPTLEAMAATTTGPDTMRSNAGRMLALGEREFGQILSSAVTETAFLDDPRLQRALSSEPDGQLDFSAWQTEAMSVFLCLPAHLLLTFNRWLRLMVTAALEERMQHRKRGPKPVMFILDELAALERLPPVENAIGIAAGFGIQLWSVFQDLSQMRDIYKERAPSFISNSGVRIFFGTQEFETAKYVSDTMGMQTVEMEKLQGGRVVDITQEARLLLTPDEVMRLPEDEMLVFVPTQNPLRLRRVPYYKDTRLNGRWDDPRN